MGSIFRQRDKTTPAQPPASPLSVRVLGRRASSLLFWRTLATHRTTMNWCQLVVFPWGAFNFGCVRVNFRGISIFLLFGTHSEIAFFLHLFERTPEELFWQQIDLKIRKIWFHFHCIVWAQKKRSLSAPRPPPLCLYVEPRVLQSKTIYYPWSTPPHHIIHRPLLHSKSF